MIAAEINTLLRDHPEIAEDELLLHDSLEGSTSLFEFLSQLTRRIQAADATKLGIKAYLTELRERSDRMERREEALRGLAFKILQVAGLGGKGKPVELPEATLSIRQGPRKVIVINEQEIPDECMRVRKEPNKTDIKDRLLAGADVPGCVLSNAEPVLAIRVK